MTALLFSAQKKKSLLNAIGIVIDTPTKKTRWIDTKQGVQSELFHSFDAALDDAWLYCGTEATTAYIAGLEANVVRLAQANNELEAKVADLLKAQS